MKDELRNEVKSELEAEIEEEMKIKYQKKHTTSSSGSLSDDEENKNSDMGSPELMYSTAELGTEKPSKKKHSTLIPKKLYKQV